MTRRTRTTCGLLIAFALVGFAASCGKSGTPTSPTLSQEEADDLAFQSVLLLDPYGTILDASFGTTLAPSPFGTRRESAPRLPQADFDTTYAVAGITYESSGTFYDAQGAPLANFGPSAVKLVWMTRATGTRETARDTTDLQHASTFELTGIQAADDTLTLAGTTRDTLLNRFRSLDGTRIRRFHLQAATVVTDVRLPKATGAPVGGSIAIHIEASRLRSNVVTDVEASFVADVLIEFNGSGVANVTVNGRWRYHVNLGTGVVTRA